MPSDNFVDYVSIHCTSGNGGSGSTHFRREKYIPKGGPDGGDGGRGGHVILKGNSQLWTLLHLKYKKHIKAGHGAHGSGNLKSGAQGKDYIIEVPLGTVAKDKESGEVLFEITENAQEFIIQNGGRGGLGNNNFKSSTNQTPRYAQPGQSGQEAWSILELKVLADVGLVGFPNAGKSTLLSSITAAKPKIGNYEFTTLTPNLGIVQYRDLKSFIIADIPGIIEGANEGKGLGHRFLRHIERNSCLLFMIHVDSNDIMDDYNILLNELTKYNSDLLDKSRLLVLTKSDMIDSELENEIKGTISCDIPSIFISSISNQGLDKLKDNIWLLLHNHD